MLPIKCKEGWNTDGGYVPGQLLCKYVVCCILAPMLLQHVDTLLLCAPLPRPFTLQWPLDKPATPTTKPLSFQLTYNPKALGFAGIPYANAARKILRLKVNFEAFTGNKTLNFAALPAGQPVGLALGGGTTGYFPTAETLACY